MCVGVTGIEPATTWSQTRCATGLRYAPKLSTKIINISENDKFYYQCASYINITASYIIGPMDVITSTGPCDYFSRRREK